MKGSDDIKFMRRCLDLARKAEGMTYPNPMVGSVIVHEGRITGEGYHIRAGDPHAEVLAISCVHDQKNLPLSTLYVNLEPCSHHGRTPPCADLIIAKGIRRVVVGTSDTSSKVAGQGIKKLGEAGCEVIVGVLEDSCRWLNRRFFTFHEKRRPYIILKWAQSADGFIDAERTPEAFRRPLWITGEAERVLVHRWRAAEQSILAGAGTVRTDNPQLNVRDWTGENPLRLILTGSGKIDADSMLFRTEGTNILFSYDGGLNVPGAYTVKLDEKKSSVEQVLDYLYHKGIQSLIVEGGAQVFSHFISEGFWDEARVFTGGAFFGKGVAAPRPKGNKVSGLAYSSGSLDLFLNQK
jgi:diaminohydroxyphosphoribosylaminopyrimidine deaminase/5-amino-6-(5-phosphoribosylamino)uracil reductase